MGIAFVGANESVNLVFGVWIEDNFGLAFATLSIASVVIGASELGSELLSALIIDRLGKRRAILVSLVLNCLVVALLPLGGQKLWLAIMGLALFYITFEFALISLMTLMSEVVPNARATVIAATIACFSLGRMLGALVAPGLYGVSFWASCLAAVGLNFIAMLLLTGIKVKENQTTPAV